jgi:hypothetical protein
MSNAASVARQRSDRLRFIQNSVGFVFTGYRAILHLKNVLQFSPSALQFHDQRAKWMHNFLPVFCGRQLPVRDAVRSAAKEVVKSGTPRRLVPTVIFGI